MTIDITGFDERSWPEFHRIDELAFGFTWDDDEGAVERGVLELDRSVLARLDGEVAGIASIFSMRFSVPGGAEVPTAGVTWVGVLPTHRRRGVLTALMRHQLDELHDGGEPLAALWASEPGIYGRYGYGLASTHVSVNVPSAHPRIVGPTDDSLAVRLTTPEDTVPAVEVVEAAIRRRRPGLPVRTDPWLRRLINDPPSRRQGGSALQGVVAADAAGPRAFALYRIKPDWSSGSAEGTVDVREVLGADPAAYAEVWRFLLSIDLTSTVSAWNLPVDDAVLSYLTDWRRARPSVQDSLYLRLVDLPRAVAARTYDVEVDVVIELTDPFCPWNAGRWRLTLGPEGGACARTVDHAHVALDARELGAAYLGGRGLAALAEAGLVTELRPGTLGRLSAAFRHDPAPYCPFVF